MKSGKVNTEHAGKVVEYVAVADAHGYEPTSAVIRFTDGSSIQFIAEEVQYDQFSHSSALRIVENLSDEAA